MVGGISNNPPILTSIPSNKSAAHNQDSSATPPPSNHPSPPSPSPSSFSPTPIPIPSPPPPASSSSATLYLPTPPALSTIPHHPSTLLLFNLSFLAAKSQIPFLHTPPCAALISIFAASKRVAV